MKGLFDAMSGIVFTDDARIVMICDARKNLWLYSRHPDLA
jgi:Holliday junction resolvase RusA-like endonuclease